MIHKTILIVDDNEEIRTVLSRVFTEAGATIETAGSFEGALDILQKGMPDVVILDLILPGRSGLDLANEIRTMPGVQPFMMILTNSINAEHIAEAIESDITAFVQKADHDPKDIVEMVAAHFKNQE